MGDHNGRSGNGAAPLTERLQTLAAKRRPDDDALPGFLHAYYRELPDFDVDDRTDADLYAAAVRHWALGLTRPEGAIDVAVLSPDRDRDGWNSDRSFVMITADDAPFLVDTVRIVLEQHNIATHLLVHPMLHVCRDETGRITSIGDSTSDPECAIEAWTQVEIDRCDGPTAEALQADLQTAVAQTHQVVADFEPMRGRMRDLAHLDPLLGWLVDDNFVFLGASRFVYDDTGVTRLDDGDLGLSIATDVVDPDIDLTAPAVSVARSTHQSPVHRSNRLTAVTVRHTDADGSGLVERFVGLLASTAYRQSTLSIPSVGDRARAVLGLAVDGAETHTGRSMRNVLETLPRDIVFELDADQLALLVIEVVSLQERQIVRVIDVPEPVGTWSTVLVFLPKARFSADLPERIAEFVGRAYGAPTADVESYIGTSSLARITFTVQRSSDDVPDLDDLSDGVDALTTSWSDRLLHAARRECRPRFIPQQCRTRDSGRRPRVPLGSARLRSAAPRRVDPQRRCRARHVADARVQPQSSHRSQRVAAGARTPRRAGDRRASASSAARRRALLHLRHRAARARRRRRRR